MRPLNKKEIIEEATQVVLKTSPNSLSLADQQFTYDAVAGENESQVCSIFCANGALHRVSFSLKEDFLLKSDQINKKSLYLAFFTQKALFDMVGLPMVENCLAGFNSSIFAYGQVLRSRFGQYQVSRQLLHERHICHSRT